MNFWKKWFGNTKTEESNTEQKNYKAKYFKLKKKHDAVLNEIATVAENGQIVLDEISLLRFMVFCISVQCGGSLELSGDTIKIAHEMYKEHELETKQENESIFLNVKRKVE